MYIYIYILYRFYYMHEKNPIDHGWNVDMEYRNYLDLSRIYIYIHSTAGSESHRRTPHHDRVLRKTSKKQARALEEAFPIGTPWVNMVSKQTSRPPGRKGETSEQSGGGCGDLLEWLCRIPQNEVQTRFRRASNELQSWPKTPTLAPSRKQTVTHQQSSQQLRSSIAAI